MGDYIKKEQLTGSQKIVVGDKYNDIVLQTLGRVYVKTSTKLQLLDDIIASAVDAQINENSIVSYDSETEFKNDGYIGDGKLVFIKDTSDLYISVDGEYYPIVQPSGSNNISTGNLDDRYLLKTGDTVKGTLYAEKFQANIIQGSQITSTATGTTPPFIVNSNKQVDNLNAQLLGGLYSKDYAVKDKDENIYGEWDFKKSQKFRNKISAYGDIQSGDGFASGFNGYGWKLDASTNTLTIDNLIVRKILSVYELVINKINATNGALWVSDSAKIDSVEETEEEYDEEFNQEIIEFTDGVGFNLYSDQFTGEFYKITLNSENGEVNPFRIHDILKCQVFQNGNLRGYNLIVTKVSDDYLIVRIDTETDKPIVKNDTVVRIGNISDPTRQGSIYLTSSDDNSPYIDIVNKSNKINYTSSQPRVRIGNLDGITDKVFGDLEGMGLYGENVYIKGNLAQVDNDGTTSRVVIFKGEYSEFVQYYENDQVTYNGQLYTCQISCKGQDPTTAGYWVLSVEKGEQGDPGDPGPKGEDGAGLVYYGEYDRTYKYPVNSSTRCTVKVTVEENVIYYMTKTLSELDEDIEYIQGEDPQDLKYWKKYGGNFQSVATSLLLAEEANVANFIFKDQKLKSQQEIDEVYYSEENTIQTRGYTENTHKINALTLDGQNGKVTATSIKTGEIGPRIELDQQYLSIFGKSQFPNIKIGINEETGNAELVYYDDQGLEIYRLDSSGINFKVYNSKKAVCYTISNLYLSKSRSVNGITLSRFQPVKFNTGILNNVECNPAEDGLLFNSVVLDSDGYTAVSFNHIDDTQLEPGYYNLIEIPASIPASKTGRLEYQFKQLYNIDSMYDLYIIDGTKSITLNTNMTLYKKMSYDARYRPLTMYECEVVENASGGRSLKSLDTIKYALYLGEYAYDEESDAEFDVDNEITPRSYSEE